MPLINTRPLEAPPPPVLFVKLLGGTGTEIGQDMYIDGESIYAVGRYSPSPGGMFIVKYDLSGNVQWQRSLSSTENFDLAYGVTTDDNGDVYLTGREGASGALNIITAKYSSNGVLQWQRSLGGVASDEASGIASDGTDVVVVGYTSNQGVGGNDAFICKYNSSGVLQWQRALGDTSTGQERFRGQPAIDVSGNIYVAGNHTGSGISSRMLLVKYNSSGTVQWSRSLGSTSTSDPDYGQNVAFDSNGDLLIAGSTRAVGESTYYHLVMKYSSAGVLQWIRKLGHSAHNNNTGRIIVDNNDNVILMDADLKNGESSHKVYFAKYNNSGVLQFQRLFGAQVADAGLGGDVDSNGNIYSYGYTGNYIQSNTEAMLCKFPSDGSGTGNLATGWFNDFIYEDASSSHTDVDASSLINENSVTLTETTTTLTDAAGTLTDAATTYTETTLV